MLAGENVTAGFVVPTVASCVDLVVHLAMDAGGARRVREIVGVTGRVEGSRDAPVIETTELFASRRGRLERVDGFPPHADRYEAAGVDLGRLLGRSLEPVREA